MSRFVRQFQWLESEPDLPAGCKFIPNFPHYCARADGTIFSSHLPLTSQLKLEAA